MDAGLKKSFKSNVRSEKRLDTNFVLDHEEKETFRCDICGKSFTTKANLTKHIGAIHDGKKPFTYM